MKNKNLQQLFSYLFRLLIGRPFKMIIRPIKALLKEFSTWTRDVHAFGQFLSATLKLHKEDDNFGMGEIINKVPEDSSINIPQPDRKPEIRQESGTHHNPKARELAIAFLQQVAKNSNPKISFVSPMRFTNNIEEHSPEIFFDSLIKNTQNLDNVEVIIAIDEDDDLSHFVRLKKKYCDRIKNIRIYISDKCYGYKSLHLYDKFLYQHLSPSSKMVADFADDCRIVMKDWDKYVLDIDASIKDNIYFIHTNNFEREKYVGPIGNDIIKLVWCLQAISPASYFPIVSRKVLEIATKCLDFLNDDEKSQWAPLTNSSFYDCYIDIISHLVQGNTRKQRVFYSKLINICPQYLSSDKRRNIIKFDSDIGLCHPKHGLSPNDMGFIILLKPQTQIHIATIVNEISKEIN